jgi:hypothetical protein
MVLPQEGFGQLRVRVVRDSSGRVVGFQDPDKDNIFISRTDAIQRVRFNTEEGQIQDSFGNNVGVAALAYPKSGQTVAYVEKEATYIPLSGPPEGFKPASNEEIVERVTVIGADGELHTFEISYGGGQKYDPAKYGGKWRYEVSNALGQGEEERIPTEDLQRAVVDTVYLYKIVR